MHSFARTATIKKANCSYNTADGVKGALAENRSNGLPEHCMAFNLPEARCSE
jgi:O-acetyl-ADP-ribose deacetylase (regulator of RNase III)